MSFHYTAFKTLLQFVRCCTFKIVKMGLHKVSNLEVFQEKCI